MGFSFFERFIAFRYIRTKRKESFINVIMVFSTLGIMLGVATLIIVMSVMNGFRIELQGRILGLNSHFNVMDSGSSMKNYDAIVGKIEPLKSITSVMPVIQSQALATANGMSQGVMVRAYTPEALQKKTTLFQAISSHGEGFDINAFKGHKILVGDRFAETFDLHEGSQLTLISPRIRSSAFGSVPRQVSLEVIGIFSVGMYEYDQNFIFMPLETAQIFFDMPESVSGLEVYVPDPSNLDQARRDIYSVLTPYERVVDWQTSSGFFEAIIVERNVMFIILGLIILVAAFNIISGMVMLVKEKGKDIAILRTMGASRASILRIFFLSGSVIGVSGTLLGFLIGILFVENIEGIRQLVQAMIGQELFSAEVYYLTKLPAILEWSEVIKIVILSLSLSFLATIYPAWKAARLDPVEALRYE